MKKLALVLGPILVVGCASLLPVSQSPGASLVLSPRISEGRFLTQSTVSVYNSASIDHLTIKIFQGSSELAAKTIPQSDLAHLISFTHLKAATSYRIKSYAYKADNSLISHDDASSWLDITTGTDDSPSIASLPVHLIDIPFDGQGTTSIQVTAGGYNYAGTEKMGFLLKGVVTTFAGQKGVIGSADGTGVSAQFRYPADCVFDGNGSIYVSDYFNYVIRKILLATGEVTTIAGTKNATGSLDATGTAAQFNNPEGLAFDGNGNLYVADASNHAIRKIVLATGAVTTIAGTKGVAGSVDATGTSAQFSCPRSLALDGNGNLYVTDSGNVVIRKIVLASNAVTTIAGWKGHPGLVNGTGTAAQLDYPMGVVFDGNGNLYVAEWNNNAIRKIDLATKAVTTLAGGSFGTADGTGTSAKFYNPTGLALDGNGNLYVVDTYNNAIRKIDLDSRVVTTLAGGSQGTTDGTGSSAQFYQPWGLAFDGNGYLYVADFHNHAIRMLK